MADIKSAIELAMESTKNLVMDDEEKRTLATKELENQVKAIVRRYLEGIIGKDRVTAELAGLTGDRELKTSFLIDVAVEEFDGSDYNRSFSLLELAADGLEDLYRSDYRKVYQGLRGELQKKEKSTRETIMVSLESMGITGDAVEPNFEAWDEWRLGNEEVRTDLKDRMAKWKKERRS
jgi:hypothetical protein